MTSRRTVSLFAIVALALSMAMGTFLVPGTANGQDNPTPEPTAAFGTGDPGATPVTEVIALEDGGVAPEFTAGPWRIAIIGAERASKFDQFELSRRENKDWIIVIADITDWTEGQANLDPTAFAIRLDGGAEPRGFARKSTQKVAGLLGLEPVEIDAGVPFDPGETVRVALVFQILHAGTQPALVLGDSALPLASSIARGIPFDNLPAPIVPGATEPAKLDEVIDGGVVTVDGSSEQLALAGVDAPVADECFAPQATAHLEDTIPGDLLLEREGERTWVWAIQRNGLRVLVNQEQVGNGFAADSTGDGSRFSEWMHAGEATARSLPAGLWKECTSPHGTLRPAEQERTVLTLRSGEEASTYKVWILWAPEVVAGDDGSAWVFFSAAADSGAEAGKKRLYGAHYDAGTGSWSDATPLPGGDVQFGATAAIDEMGTVHVVYSDRVQDQDGFYSTLLYTHDDGYGGWIPPVQVAPDPAAGHQLAPDMAIDADGVLHLIWQDQRAFSQDARASSPANADIFASELLPGATKWELPVLVNVHLPTAAGSRPHIAIDGDRVIAAWSVYTSVRGLNAAARVEWAWRPLADRIDWSFPQTLLSGRGDLFGGRLVDMAADPTGGVVFTYARQGNADTFLFVRRLAPGSVEWTGDALVAWGGNGQYPAIAANEAGTVFVTYNVAGSEKVDVGISAIAYHEVDPGVEVNLTNKDAGTQGISAVAADAIGRPIIVTFSEPVGGDPDAVVVIQNPIIPAFPASQEKPTSTPAPEASPEASPVASAGNVDGRVGGTRAAFEETYGEPAGDVEVTNPDQVGVSYTNPSDLTVVYSGTGDDARVVSVTKRVNYALPGNESNVGAIAGVFAPPDYTCGDPVQASDTLLYYTCQSAVLGAETGNPQFTIAISLGYNLFDVIITTEAPPA